ncbi:DUF3618 domain-containing protein [uncultured Friedmanniella sp.]|uniref:DUF3618 domain-containing protein n=1 Tax=uncultured Friedmanniella sp. TaxID=335381 RepID=UPI0035CBED41
MVAGRPDRDKDQIEADLAATRDRLVTAVESLIDQVHPQRIKQREIAGAKRLLNIELENAKALVYNARGDLRTDRLAVVGGAAAGVVSLLVVLRAVVRRSRS